MDHHYTSHEEYLYLLAFFEANPALDSFRLPTPPYNSPTRFTPQTTNLHIPTDTFVLPENTRSQNVFRSESVRLKTNDLFPHPPPKQVNAIPDRARVRTKRRVVPNQRPRSRRAALGLRYLTFEDRLKVLEKDPLVLKIWQEENMVQCSGCEKRIQLDNRKRRSLQLQNWNTHKSRCLRNNNSLN